MTTATTTETTIRIDGRDYRLYDEIGDAVLPDLDRNDWRDNPDDCYDNGIYSVYAYKCGDRTLYVDADQGSIVSLNLNSGDIYDHLNDWDYDSMGYASLAEWFADMGLDGERALKPAAEDYDGECRVWCEPQYYHGTYNAPKPQLARDDEGNVLEFVDYAEAKAYVDDYYNAPSGYDGIPACNVLSHGQAGADILTIVQA